MKFHKLLNKIERAFIRLVIPCNIYPKNYIMFELSASRNSMILFKSAEWIREYMDNPDILNMKVDKISTDPHNTIIIYLKK